MHAVIALVGRPNVGKSTLFNSLTGTRDALVGELPGLTRDRQYGLGRVAGGGYVVVDTGGLGDDPDGVELGMREQALLAIAEADLVLFLVDGQAGLSAADQDIAESLRRAGRRVLLVVNKVDGRDPSMITPEFHALGLGEPIAIAARRRQGLTRLMEQALARLDELAPGSEPGSPVEARHARTPAQAAIRVAVVGRPNVGKSTLVNRLLGDERVLVFDLPGTTRDSIRIPFQRDGQDYVLIDTAGVRRRSRVSEVVEKFSVIKTLQAIEAAEVVLLVVDAHEGVADQDAHLAGHILDAGRALVLVVNKWDGLDRAGREALRRLLDVKLAFLGHIPVHTVSALKGSGVGQLLPTIRKVHGAAHVDLSTARLTQVLERAVASHPPPYVRGRRIKLRYAHQGGRNPPVIVIHGNQTDAITEPYRRYLENRFREALDLHGTPVRLSFRSGENPYAGRRNTLTPRQIKHRQRLLRHVKR